MLLVLWIGHGFDEHVEAGNATDVVRRGATGTVDVVSGGILQRYRHR